MSNNSKSSENGRHGAGSRTFEEARERPVTDGDTSRGWQESASDPSASDPSGSNPGKVTTSQVNWPASYGRSSGLDTHDPGPPSENPGRFDHWNHSSNSQDSPPPTYSGSLAAPGSNSTSGYPRSSGHSDGRHSGSEQPAGASPDTSNSQTSNRPGQGSTGGRERN
ncbi:hypothetical protein P7C73_g5512, partial [Tremellales sp. Uapishka_1]